MYLIKTKKGFSSESECVKKRAKLSTKWFRLINALIFPLLQSVHAHPSSSNIYKIGIQVRQ